MRTRLARSRAAAITIATAAAACGPRPYAVGNDDDPAGEARLTGVVAHRGASYEAPENTLAALRRGWELGAESCEIDVRVTRDGEVVLMHDATTERTGGLARGVADQTLAELKTLDVGGWKGSRWQGERIPTLEEALAVVPPGRMLFVEVKTGSEGAAAIAAAITRGDPRPRGGAVALQGYDADAVAGTAELVWGVPAYWTVDPPRGADGAYLPYGDDVIAAARARSFAGLAVDHRGVDDRFAAAVTAAGLVLDVWTVDDPAAIAAWRRRARWVETNRPDLVR